MSGKTKFQTACKVYKEKGLLSFINVSLKKIMPSGNYFLSWDSRILFRNSPVSRSCNNLAYCLSPGEVHALVGLNGMTRKIIDIATKRGEKCWVIRCEGEVAAYVWISSAREKVMSDTGYYLKSMQPLSYWWRDIYVAPGYRGRKLPRELFCAWVSSLKENERKDIYTEIDPGNLNSVRAHISLGFRKIGILYMVCVLGGRFYYLRSSELPRFSFRFYPRNVYYSLLIE
jgi:RimJ/RimL family protein N-acetyltransferase